jgi:hypothetical protein
MDDYWFPHAAALATTVSSERNLFYPAVNSGFFESLDRS